MPIFEYFCSHCRVPVILILDETVKDVPQYHECPNDNPEPGNEGELVTKLTRVLEPKERGLH